MAYQDVPDTAKDESIQGAIAPADDDTAKDVARDPLDGTSLDAMLSELCDYANARIGKELAAGKEDSNFDAMVTRLLDRQETLGNPNAIAAIQKEAAGLVSKGTWDLDSVREKDEVVKDARKKNAKTHIGSLMAICSEKFAELEEQFRILKGRVDYRSDSAKNEEGAAAVYQNLSASPTSIQGMNANIAYGRIPGHKTTSADAVKAYVQATLGSKHPTWVQIPKELRPSH